MRIFVEKISSQFEFYAFDSLHKFQIFSRVIFGKIAKLKDLFSNINHRLFIYLSLCDDEKNMKLVKVYSIGVMDIVVKNGVRDDKKC
ncbi:hypothetical protein BpHYR1_019760 [Brachionus plicatilis]|uniref:Uncharacterized protein n=1 Tax=Brachionus plicatilis TaxID=10195 RepID=A0A3M7PQ51_BRAPC|nr:hypothetical protein BpHYR1_019760 [Brachionus plicatilis]